LKGDMFTWRQLCQAPHREAPSEFFPTDFDMWKGGLLSRVSGGILEVSHYPSLCRSVPALDHTLARPSALVFLAPLFQKSSGRDGGQVGGSGGEWHCYQRGEWRLMIQTTHTPSTSRKLG